MANRLDGKHCVIVGGSSGIGLAIAREFHQEGAKVLVAALAPAPTAQPWEYVAMDATQEAQVSSTVQTALVKLGGLDVLCHAAGGSGRSFGDGPLHACTLEGWQRTLDLNLQSVFLTNRAATRHWLETGTTGVILNVASVLPLAPSPEHFDVSAYAVAKGAIITLSRQVAARYAKHGIRCNVLAPGLVDTPMAKRALEDAAIADYVRHKQPLSAGPCVATDCATAATYLCSDESRHVTGQVLAIDGGWSVTEANESSKTTSLVCP